EECGAGDAGREQPDATERGNAGDLPAHERAQAEEPGEAEAPEYSAVAAGLELGVDLLEVVPHGVAADGQLDGDLVVREPAVGEREHFAFARGQRLRGHVRAHGDTVATRWRRVPTRRAVQSIRGHRDALRSVYG